MSDDEERNILLDGIAGELRLIRKLFERYIEIKEYEHKRDKEIDEANKDRLNIDGFPASLIGSGYGKRWKKAGEHIDHE